MDEIIKSGLHKLLEDGLNKRGEFSKKTYEGIFLALYEDAKEMLARIIEQAEGSDETEELLKTLADIIPAKAEVTLNEHNGKRRREAALLDYNMAMAIYVLPVLNYSKNIHLMRLSELIVEDWNNRFSGPKLGNSDYESISGGFKNRMCYITTAVCETLGKGDECYELSLLRDYRDEYLMSLSEGEKIVKEYYNIAPTIVTHINRRKDADKIYSDIWDEYLQPCVSMIEAGEQAACKKTYSDMVRNLQKQYLYS